MKACILLAEHSSKQSDDQAEALCITDGILKGKVMLEYPEILASDAGGSTMDGSPDVDFYGSRDAFRITDHRCLQSALLDSGWRTGERLSRVRGALAIVEHDDYAAIQPLRRQDARAW